MVYTVHCMLIFHAQIVIKYIYIYIYIILVVNRRVHTALVCPSNTRSHINIDEYYFLINNQFILHCTRFIVKIYIVDIIIYNVKVLDSLIVLIS